MLGLLKKLFGLGEKKREQTTFCWCPKCNNELISSGSYDGEERLVYYRCSECNSLSEWLFDAPAPILIRINGKLFNHNKS